MFSWNWAIYTVRVDTIQEDHTYHTSQHQTFYRNINFELLNFRWVQNG